LKDQTNHLGIKKWALDDRPREKLQSKGKISLSDAELIAILIGSGNSKETAVDLAKRILASVHNNLNELSKLTVNDLCEFKGIGEAKAISIVAALELGRRRRLSDARARETVSSSEHAYEFLQPQIGDISHEEFWVIFLSASNKVLDCKCISKGGITGTVADIRMIFKEGIIVNASAAVVAHNHPSGNIKPSLSDKRLTQKLVEGGNLMDIKIIDHLIVCEHEYYSFADEGLI
jgi:DNA repair protein RadC